MLVLLQLAKRSEPFPVPLKTLFIAKSYPFDYAMSHEFDGIHDAAADFGRVTLLPSL
jgi:hypothetical protein